MIRMNAESATRALATANANGDAPFGFSLAVALPAGQAIIAAANGTGDNTSEFSASRWAATVVGSGSFEGGAGGNSHPSERRESKGWQA